MAFLATLWLPILLSAVGVFVASSILHMVLTYHNTDYTRLPSEDQIADALRKFNIGAGKYFLPHCGSGKERGSPEYQEKMKKGPVAIMTFMDGPPNMGKLLFCWFLYCVAVSVFAAYIAWHGAGAAPSGMAVLRFAGCTAFAAYVMGHWQDVIWAGESSASALKASFDGLVYALVTGGIMAWLWP